MPRRPLICAAALALLAASLSPAPAAQAGDVFGPSATGAVTLDGRGYGHGIGMSQYGAQGAALRGLSSAQILSFYYPGTAASVIGNPVIRVWLEQDTGADTIVANETGLAARDTATGAVTALGARGRTQWRVIRSGTGYALAGWTGSAWAPQATSASGFDLSSSDGTVTIVLPSAKTFVARGAVRGVQDGTVFRTVVVTPMETYLRGVVPHEMPYTWRPAALQSQAIAARTFAEKTRRAATARPYDICNSQSCQVYGGVAYERPETDAAITATTGAIRTYGGAPITAMYSSSNGGWTRASAYPGSYPYLPAKPDPYDAIPAGSTSRWKVTRTAAEFQAAWPAIGAFRQLRVTARDGVGPWGGRVTRAQVVGSSGTVTITGAQLRAGLRLRSEWVDSPMSPTTARRIWPRDYTGDGRADLLLRSGGDLVELQTVGTAGQRQVRTGAGGWQVFPRVVSTGDWDGAGVSDLVAIDAAGDAYAYTGRGAGDWSGKMKIGSGLGGYVSVLSPGDWDRNGFADLMAVDTAGRLLLIPRDGAGQLRPAAVIGQFGWRAFTMVFGVGDVDRDGFTDLMTVDASGRLWLYPGTATGHRPGVVTGLFGWGAFVDVAGAGDVTGDGLVDIVALGKNGTLLLYPGTGGPRLGTPRAIATGLTGQRIVR